MRRPAASPRASLTRRGSLVAPAAAHVEALWFLVLDCMFLPNTGIMPNDSGEQLVEVGPSVIADKQDDVFPRLEADDFLRPKRANCGE